MLALEEVVVLRETTRRLLEIIRESEAQAVPSDILAAAAHAAAVLVVEVAVEDPAAAAAVAVVAVDMAAVAVADADNGPQQGGTCRAATSSAAFSGATTSELILIQLTVRRPLDAGELSQRDNYYLPRSGFSSPLR